MTTNHSPSLAPSDKTLLPSSNSIDTTKPFPFPRDYHFPPFFTRQPTLTTRHAQLQKWSSLILSYCRYHKIWKLALADAIESEIFWNKKLRKRLSREDAREVVEFMRKEGRAEWVGGGVNKDGTGMGSVFWVWWRNPEEWAGLIADWVSLLLVVRRVGVLI
jgi:ESCRT-II complex subunit VPS25